MCDRCVSFSLVVVHIFHCVSSQAKELKTSNTHFILRMMRFRWACHKGANWFDVCFIILNATCKLRSKKMHGKINLLLDCELSTIRVDATYRSDSVNLAEKCNHFGNTFAPMSKSTLRRIEHSGLTETHFFPQKFLITVSLFFFLCFCFLFFFLNTNSIYLLYRNFIYR